jgi:rsbT co-antagonist protein RsbR
MKDGSYRWIHDQLRLMCDDQGHPVEMVGSWQDITDRKQAEQELIVFRAVIEHAPDIIGFAQLDTAQMIYANPAHHRLLGYEHSVVGMHLTEIFAEDPDYLMNLVAVGIEQGRWSGVISYRRADGSTLPAILTGFIIRDEADNPIAIAGIAHDISEQLHMEQERAALQQQVIDIQQDTLRELSTPLIPISDKVVIMPLVGTIDTQRAQQIMETLLTGVAQQQATLAILDITGVAVVDTQVAQALIQAAQAVKLLGAQVMLTGIQPAIAQTLVHLGMDLQGIVTHGSLQSGITAALQRHEPEPRPHRGTQPMVLSRKGALQNR